MLNLNSDCTKLLPKVEKVFLFDDDDIKLLLFEILGQSVERTVGLKSFCRGNMCSQISFYEMPNGKVCACTYPSSSKVDYDKFNKEMHKVFSFVKDTHFEGSTYAFLLYCEKNGYKRKDNFKK